MLFSYKYKNKFKSICALAAAMIVLASCGQQQSAVSDVEVEDLDAPLTEQVKGSRDNTPCCLVPEHPGDKIYGNEYVTIDASNTAEGYICVKYNGSCEKAKFQILCPNKTTYTYNLTGDYDTFPLTQDSGRYVLSVLENVEETKYSLAYSYKLDLTVENILGPYLYPNQYVNFDSDDLAVEKAAELAYPANDDLEVVTRVYNYVTTHVTYDTELASTVESGYLPDVDRTLTSGKGICLDYASLMAAMLRSQSIPTHMEVGYAGSAYHAWISVYSSETGWVNGIIQFDGTSWELMDPTFASSSDEKTLEEFIGDGSNYETKYIY